MDKAAVIVSNKNDEISDKIKNCMGIEENEYDVSSIVKNNLSGYLICVFSQKEMRQVKEIVKSVDNFAFIILFDIKEVYGQGFKKL